MDLCINSHTRTIADVDTQFGDGGKGKFVSTGMGSSTRRDSVEPP